MIEDNSKDKFPPLKAQFYWKREEGKEPQLFCRVRISPLSIWDQPIREQDKHEFAEAWEQFQLQEQLRAANDELAKAKAAKARKPKADPPAELSA